MPINGHMLGGVALHTRLTSWLAAVASVIVAATAATPAAQAAPQWLAQFDVYETEAGQSVQNETTETDAHGDAFAAWETYGTGTSIVQAALRPAGGDWQAPATLSDPAEEGFNPSLAVDAQGDAVAVWLRFNAATGERTIQSTAMPAAGSWEAPVSLTTPGEFVISPRIAVDAHGEAVAVWELHAEEWMVQVATRPPDGVWTEPVTIAHTGSQLPSARVFSDAAGAALATWIGTNGADEVVQSAAKPAGGDWGTPEVISPDGQNEAGVSVGFDAHADAVAVWQANIDGTERVEGASRPSGGPWQAPVLLSGEPEAYAPSLSVDAQGDAIAAWQHYINGCESIYQAAAKPSGGSWEPAANVSEPGSTADGAQVSLDADGRVVAAWDADRCLEGRHEESIQATSKAPGAAWEKPVNLTEADPLGAYDVSLTNDPSGNAVAVWTAYRHSAKAGVVQGTAYDAGGPLLESLSIPSTGSTGIPVSFSVAPLDAWSQLGQTRWAFGDGTFAMGPVVTHRYTAPGRYQVTVEAEDVLGNRTATQGIVAVTPAVTRLAPHRGPEGGGTIVEIHGKGLGAVTAVHFGDADAPSFTVLSAHTITAVTPPGTGTVGVTVTSPDGTSTSEPRDGFTYRSPRGA